MSTYLKRATPQPPAASAEVRATVSEILLDVERHGAAAVRRWSKRLDDWEPVSFRVTDAELAAASRATEDTLQAHLLFALDQVRRFARYQLETLTELEVRTLPGVTLGHRHIAVDAVGSYS